MLILATVLYALVAVTVWNCARTQLLTLPEPYRPSPIVCGLFWGPALLAATIMLVCEVYAMCYKAARS